MRNRSLVGTGFGLGSRGGKVVKWRRSGTAVDNAFEERLTAANASATVGLFHT